MSLYLNPRLKPSVEFYWEAGQIYFFHRPTFTIQLKDTSKFILSVCELLDGQKSFDQIVEYLMPLFPIEAPFLEKLLSVLDKEYLLEDLSFNYPQIEDEYALTRWSRNIEFFGAHCRASDNKYSFQEKLDATKVAIFGLGGVGSNILYNLAALGVRSITAVDFDKVELSNLNRQIIYNESDVGRWKSEAAMDRIKNFIPNANLNFINKKISSSKDIEEIIVGHDIVIAAIDSPREKIIDWFNLACVKYKIPFLCGSLDSVLVTYYAMAPGETGCIECWKESKRKSGFVFQDIIQRDGFQSAPSPNVAIMPLISLVSGFIANEFLKIITKIAPPQSLGKLYSYDFFSSQVTVSESWEKNPACSVCA